MPKLNKLDPLPKKYSYMKFRNLNSINKNYKSIGYDLIQNTKSYNLNLLRSDIKQKSESVEIENIHKNVLKTNFWKHKPEDNIQRY